MLRFILHRFMVFTTANSLHYRIQAMDTEQRHTGIIDVVQSKHSENST